jgi:hypothetical protein
MAETAPSCSSGCTVRIRSVRDRRLPAKRSKHDAAGAWQESLFQLLAVRMSFFTLRDLSVADNDPEQGFPYLRNQRNRRLIYGFAEINAAVLRSRYIISSPHPYIRRVPVYQAAEHKNRTRCPSRYNTGSIRESAGRRSLGIHRASLCCLSLTEDT